ncbi:Hypothetical protein HVR_LOCUS36 [uncultured virus]|nr:Hypothetical protein HVR_LOCUS36 [uncultured virus]
MEYSITWESFQPELNKVDMFEDPVYESYIEKDQFLEIYFTILKALDGSDLSSYIDFYFQPSPINPSIYIFVDENAKLDFRDFAYEKGLIPEMKEIIESESRQEKLNRNKSNCKGPSAIRNFHIEKHNIKVAVCGSSKDKLHARNSTKLDSNYEMGACSHPQQNSKNSSRDLRSQKLSKEDRVSATIRKLSEKLEKETNIEMRKKLEDKLERTRTHLSL